MKYYCLILNFGLLLSVIVKCIWQNDNSNRKESDDDNMNFFKCGWSREKKYQFPAFLQCPG